MPRVKRQQAIWLCFGQIRRYFDLWMHKPSSRARSSHHICAAFVRHMSDGVCVVFAFDVIRSLIDKTTSHKMKRMNKMRVVSLMAAVIVWIRSDVYDYFNGHPLKCVASFFVVKNYYRFNSHGNEMFCRQNWNLRETDTAWWYASLWQRFIVEQFCVNGIIYSETEITDRDEWPSIIGEHCASLHRK